MKSMKIRSRMISSMLAATAALTTAAAASAGTISIAVSSAINFDGGGCDYEPRQLIPVFTPVATTVAYLTDISAVSIAARLNAGDVVVIPDQEVGSILSVWGANSALVRQAVEAGGRLLVFGDHFTNDTSLLNVLISGTTTGPLIDRSSAAGPFAKSASAPSTFATTAASLIWQDGTYSIEGWNPADVIYSSGATAAVACRAVGSGHVGFIAYDFFCPTGTAQAADWFVVARAMASYLESPPDCNGNGIADATDIANHTASDCNGNGKLDSCDIASGAEVDLNADGFPDSCQSAIVSWGNNTDGQRNTPSGVGFVSAIDGGGVHTVALRGNGTVVCWGNNSLGQCSPPIGLSSVLAISAGQDHAVALKSDGTVVCWGAGTSNQGFYPYLGQSIVPAGLGSVTAVAAGGWHSLALRSNGQVVAWGSNYDGDISSDFLGQSIVPADLVSATAIGAGHQHSLAVRPDGTVRCFGWNSQGQSQPPAGLSSVVRVAGGYEHSLAQKSDGTVVAWGSNFFGERDVPAGLSAVTAIAAGDFHNIALKSDGTVVSWGYNFFGQATVAAGLDRVRCIGAGGYHSLAVRQLSPTSTIVLVSSTPTTCGLSNGAIAVTVTDAPILSWTGPSGFVSTAEDLTNLAAGTYTLTARGPGGSSTLTVTVGSAADTTAPSITSYTASASAAANAACTATVPNLTSSVVATDNCTIASITQTPLAGASVGLGATTVAITVTDAAGNSTTRTATFTVTGSPATYYADADSDGYGYGASTVSCAPIAGSVTNNTDCNDANSAIHPGATELCNGIDDDCVGGADNGLAFTNYYADADHDGFGTGSPITACSQPANSATVAGDQCDSDPLKQAPGTCGCGTPDTDANGNGIADCADVFLVLTPSATSVSSGGQFRVRVSASASLAAMAGLQLAMRYDHTHLRLDAVEPVAGGPFEAELAEQIDNASGTLRYALGVADGASGLTSAADLCDLQFTVLPGGSLCGSSVLVTFGNVGPFTTRFTRMTGGAQVPLVASLPPINLDSVPPVLSGVPSSVSVAADAGSIYGAYVAAPTVTATDDCDGTVAVDGPSWPADGMFPIGTTTLTWSATDSAGNISTETRTITVGDYQLLDASIAFQGSLSGTSTRAVRIKAGASSRVLTVDLTGNAGTLTGVQVPVAASYACIEAKDTVHTLTRTAAPSIAGTRYSASFLLVQGDSNDDDLVDIVDFGSFVADRGGGKAKDARSNFNADTLVNNADFSFITLNFFSVGESCTGALDGKQPRERIHVKELRRMGLGDLAAADLNGDGWVDARDMQSYMQGGGGAAPRPQAADAPPAAGGGW